MARVRFDGDVMLHRATRSAIAARLGKKCATATADGATAPDDWQKFRDGLDADVNRAWDESRSMDEVLRALHEGVAGAVNGAASPLVRSAIDAVAVVRKAADCGACSRHDGACVGRPLTDARFFEDDERRERRGGACLGFLRALVEQAAAWASDRYGQCARGLTLREGPTDLVIQTQELADGHDGTLPLNGFWRWDAAQKGVAVVMVSWPRADHGAEIEDALGMLPWLVFHEVAVHGHQGRARCAPIGRITGRCRFTEGAADAALRDELVWVLRDLDLPEELRPLRRTFVKETERYGKERLTQTAEDQRSGRGKETGPALKRARASGAWRLWEPLKLIEREYRCPSGWAVDVVFRLNMELDARQREALIDATDPWFQTRAKPTRGASSNAEMARRLRKAVRPHLKNTFDAYRRGGSIETLLATLERMSLQKAFV